MVGQQCCAGDHIIFDRSINNSIDSAWAVGAMRQIGAAGALQAGRPAQGEGPSTKLNKEQTKTPTSQMKMYHFTFRVAEFSHLLPGTSFGRRTAPSTNKSDFLLGWPHLCPWGELRWTCCTALWFLHEWTESSDWLRLKCCYSLGRRPRGDYVRSRHGARCHKTGNPNRFRRKLKDTKRDAAQIISGLFCRRFVWNEIQEKLICHREK